MFDFITPVGIIGILSYTFYKFVELLVRKKERLQLIEKLQEINTSGATSLEKLFGTKSVELFSKFTAIRFGCVLAGLGIGLLIAFAIIQMAFGYLLNSGASIPDFIEYEIQAIYGGSTLLFGGVGLIICYMIERRDR